MNRLLFRIFLCTIFLFNLSAEESTSPAPEAVKKVEAKADNTQKPGETAKKDGEPDKTGNETVKTENEASKAGAGSDKSKNEPAKTENAMDKAAAKPADKKDQDEMLTGEDVINVSYLSDGYSSNILEASMRSLLDSASKEDKFNFYILCGNMAPQTKERLKGLINNKNKIQFKIKFIDINLRSYNVDDMGFSASPHYLKVQLPDLLPNVDKVIFIDSDNLIKKSLRPIWNTDVQNKYAGVVHDLNAHIAYEKAVKSGSNKSKYEHIKKFFSTSLLVLNLKELRDKKIPEQFRKETVSKSHYLPDDTGILNVLFHEHVTYLSDEANISYLQMTSNKETLSKYGKTAKSALDPISIRFENASYNDPKHPYAFDFLRYLNISDHFRKRPVSLKIIDVAMLYNSDHEKLIANSMASTLHTLKSREIARFHIISDKKLGEEFVSKIEKLKKIAPFTVQYIVHKELKFSHNNAIINIPEIIPDSKLIVFLCPKTIVLDSLGQLYNVDMSSKSIAIASDITKEDMKAVDELNCGLILFNAELYRNSGLAKKLSQLIKEKSISLMKAFAETDPNGILLLPPKWNVTPNIFSIDEASIKDPMRRKTLNVIKTYPSIVHFTGTSCNNVNHPFHNKLAYYEKVINWNGKEILKDWAPSVNEGNYKYKNTSIHIGYIATQEQIQFVASSILSIVSNKHATDSLQFHIVSNSLTQDAKDKISQICKNTEFIESVLPDIAPDYPADKRELLTKTGCFTQLISSIKADKIIYLEPSTIVNGSLQELYNMSANSKVATVIKSTASQDIYSARRMYGERIPDYDQYFDTAVMSVYVNAWKKMDISAKIQHSLKTLDNSTFTGLLNSIIAREVKFTQQKWNVGPEILFLLQSSKNARNDMEQEYQSAFDTPLIINFNNNSYMQTSDNAHPFIFEFLHYLSLTPWKELITYYNRKPQPVIQIKEVEVPKIVVPETKSFGDGLKKWILSLLKKIPRVKTPDPEGLAIPKQATTN